VTAKGDFVIRIAERLVTRCDRLQGLLRAVLDHADQGLYDPVADIHLVRLPGAFIRTARQLLDTAEHPPE
jgi:hypothetical protein